MTSFHKFKVYIERINGFPIAVLLLFESGLADSVLTAQNVAKYGLDIEGNPLLKAIMEHWGVFLGLFLTKLIVFIVIVYTAHMMNKTGYKVRGEYLLYGASICWLYGAVTNALVQ
jgi:hypothetical protein